MLNFHLCICHPFERQVALDCLSYHATASDPDTDALTKAPVPSSQVFNLDRCVCKSFGRFHYYMDQKNL